MDYGIVFATRESVNRARSFERGIRRGDQRNNGVIAACGGAVWPMNARGDSRRRMVNSTIELLRQQGARATTIDGVLAHSGAPRGSVYHHFPGGRTQLIDEAVATAAAFMTGVIQAATTEEDPLKAVDDFFALWRDQLAGSDFRSGCPIVAVAVEHNDDAPQLARSAGAAFAEWQSAFAAMFRKHGVPAARSRRLANLVIAAEEGAVILARAQQSSTPIEDAALEIHDLLRRVLVERQTTEDTP